MLRIRRLTDYGIVLLAHLASDPRGATHNARELSAQTGLPLPVVSKILKHLTHSGVLVSQRGAKGGYGLARDARHITVAEIVSALEGPIALTECADGEGQCVEYLLGQLIVPKALSARLACFGTRSFGWIENV